MTGPLDRVATAVAGVAATAAQNDVRIGVVTRFASGRITVRISGSDVLVQASYLWSYLPLLGDKVVVLRQGDTWVVLGSYTYELIDGNPILNPSFRDGQISQTVAPTNWLNYQFATTAGTTTHIGHLYFDTVGVVANSFDGPDVLYVSGAGSGAGTMNTENFIQSSSFSVIPGETWTASVFAFMTHAEANARDAVYGAAGIYFSWYDTSAKSYPNQLGDSDLVGGLMPHESWVSVSIPGASGGVLVPPNAKFARVVIYNLMNSTNDVSTPQPMQMYYARCAVTKLADATTGR